MNKRNIWIVTGSLGVVALGATAAAADYGQMQTNLGPAIIQTGTQATERGSDDSTKVVSAENFNSDDWMVKASSGNTANTPNTPNTAPSPVSAQSANTPNTPNTPASAPTAVSAVSPLTPPSAPSPVSAQSAQSAPSAG